MSFLLTPSQSVSHKRFHQCVNHKKKLSFRHLLPTFGSFSFFQASFWLGVNKVLQKLTKSYKSELRLLFQCCILIPTKCLHKTPFQHTVPRPPFSCILQPTAVWSRSRLALIVLEFVAIFLCLLGHEKKKKRVKTTAKHKLAIALANYISKKISM